MSLHMDDITEDRAVHLMFNYLSHQTVETFDIGVMNKCLRRLAEDAWKENEEDAVQDGYVQNIFIEECESEVYDLLYKWNILVNGQFQPRDTWMTQDDS